MRVKAPHLATAALAAAAVVALAGCGSSSSAGSASSTTTAQTAAAGSSGYGSSTGSGSTTAATPAAATSTAALSADPSGALKFNTTTLAAKAGTVTITMANPSSSGVPHAIAVEGNGVDQDGKTVEPGGSSTLTVKLKPGTYTFYCPVPGHEAAGMKGTLTVSVSVMRLRGQATKSSIWASVAWRDASTHVWPSRSQLTTRAPSTPRDPHGGAVGGRRRSPADMSSGVPSTMV